MAATSNVLNTAQTTVSGIAITSEDTGTEGIRVEIVQGECFGGRIEWYLEDSYEKTVTVVKDPETGLPMLTYPLGGELKGLNMEFRGVEANGVTWWRYAHEIDPNEYREHCLRIIRRI